MLLALPHCSSLETPTLTDALLEKNAPRPREYASSINPNVNDPNNARKVVRGGSWKDVAYFLQVSSRDYEYADSARSYIGFRTVQDYMGTEVTKNAATN